MNYNEDVVSFGSKYVALSRVIAKKILEWYKEMQPHLDNEFEFTNNLLPDFLARLLKQELGIKVKFVTTNKSAPRGLTFVYAMDSKGDALAIKIEFVKDIARSLRRGDNKVHKICEFLGKDLQHIVDALKDGEEPFKEDYTSNKYYIVFEVEAGGVTSTDGANANDGTLASFKGVLPIEPVGFVEPDGDEKNLIPKEVKKDVFILRPTKEQLYNAIYSNIVNSTMSEFDKKRYIQIFNKGKVNILKEKLNESINRLSNKFSFSKSIIVTKISYK